MGVLMEGTSVNEISESEIKAEDKAQALAGLLSWAETMRAHEDVEAMFSVTPNADETYDVDLKVFLRGADRTPSGHGSSKYLTLACAAALAALGASLEELG